MTTMFRVLKQDGTVLDILIDDQDWDIVSRFHWHMSGGKGGKGKYVQSSTGVYLHRLIAQRMGLIVKAKGEGRSVPSIDHENGNKLDNRRSNLRLRTRAQQMINPNDALRVTNRSGYRGVSYVKSRAKFGKPWFANVMVAGKTINLGWYATAEEAHQARLRWDEQHAEE